METQQNMHVPIDSHTCDRNVRERSLRAQDQ